MNHDRPETDEAELIEFARGELLNGDLNEQIWQKALALSGQMEANAREKYLLLRVAQLRRNLDLEARYAAKQSDTRRKESTLNQLSDRGLENSVLSWRAAHSFSKKRSPWSMVTALIVIVAVIALIAMRADLWDEEAFKSEMESLMNRSDTLPAVIASDSVDVEANSTVVEPTRRRLRLATKPSGAKVQILNIKPHYYDGIRLAEGRYHLKVSKEGYESKLFWIDVSDDVNRSVTLLSDTFALTVKTSPSDARVQILNIREVYHDAIALPKGTYSIRVSKRGYQPLKKRITLTSDIVFKARMFTLKREKRASEYISHYRLPFSEAFPGCLEKDMRLPSVSELVDIIAANKITEHKEAWFWTAERSDAISYNIVQNVSERVVRNAKLSERHYFYCIR